MTEEEEFQTIAAIVANPTLEGLERLIEIRDFSKSEMAQLEAISAMLLIGFGPPSREANEEMAVYAEAAGIDLKRDVQKRPKEAARCVGHPEDAWLASTPTAPTPASACDSPWGLSADESHNNDLNHSCTMLIQKRFVSSASRR